MSLKMKATASELRTVTVSEIRNRLGRLGADRGLGPD